MAFTAMNDLTYACPNYFMQSIMIYCRKLGLDFFTMFNPMNYELQFTIVCNEISKKKSFIIVDTKDYTELQNICMTFYLSCKENYKLNTQSELFD